MKIVSDNLFFINFLKHAIYSLNMLISFDFHQIYKINYTRYYYSTFRVFYKQFLDILSLSSYRLYSF